MDFQDAPFTEIAPIPGLEVPAPNRLNQCVKCLGLIEEISGKYFHENGSAKCPPTYATPFPTAMP